MPANSSNAYTFDRVFRLAMGIALLSALIYAVSFLSDVLIPFAIAFLLAYLLNPLVDFMQTRLRVRNRALTVLLCLIVVVGCFVGLASILIPLVLGEFREMGRLLTEVLNDSRIDERAMEYLAADLWNQIKEIATHHDVQTFFKSDSLTEVMSATARKILPGLWGIFSGAISVIIGVVGVAIILLYLVFHSA